MWDLVVVGAGPAGSAAALSALQQRPGARVLLLDRADFPRDKCCGDGVAPHALEELSRLGVADLLADRVRIGRLRLVSPRGDQAATRLVRPDVVVPRTVLDGRLVQAAVAAGAELRRQSVRSVVVTTAGVLVDGEPARAVVGADGAQGVVRRLVAVPRQPAAATAVAVRGYAPSPPGEPEQVVVMDSSAWPAYAWRFDAGDGTSNVGYGLLLTQLRAAPHPKQLLHRRLVELLPEAEGATGLRSHHLPLSTWRPRQPDGPVLLAGDAASLVNPLTGEGIFYALLSGRLAGAAAVGGGDPGAAYRVALARELGRHLRHTTLLSRLTRSPRLLDAGVRRAGRDQAAMDALVEVGLGRGLITWPLVRALAP